MSEPVVVVVDDEPVILGLLETVLEGGPWSVVACGTGREALGHIERGGVDVLLTDKNLPDVGGLELVAAAKAADPDTQCLVITGYPSLDTALEAMQLQVFDYIVKPPQDIFEVRRKVEKAVDRVRILRENRRLLADLQEKNRQLEATLAELRAAQAEVIQTEKLAGIGTLAAGVAHEVSSPLFGILGLAEAIVDEDDLPTIRDHAREIVSLSRAIRDIVVELTRYSRSSQDEAVGPVDLARAVQDAVRLVSRSTGFPEERLLVDVAGASPVRGRGNEIQQVFVNLVKNGVEAAQARHGPGQGTVRILATTEGGQVVTTVSDDGIGIAAADLGQVFDPFFTTKAPGQGTGLGLNIVYRIVTRYRGTVSVDSRPGEGTTFTVRMPVAASPPGGG